MTDTPEAGFFGFELYEPNKPGAENVNSYTARLYRDVTGLMRSEMGPIYVEPVNLESVTLLPSRAVLHRNDHAINLDARRVTEETRSLPIERQKAQLFKSGVIVSKRLSDAIILLHELCHEMYETTNPPPAVNETKDSRDRMISEGFATFMDIYFISLLSGRPELLGLSKEDQEALEEAKRYRIGKLKELRHKHSHRVEGVLLMHRIFKQAKDEAGKDNQAGLQAIRAYIDGVDRESALTISRTEVSTTDSLEIAA